MNIEYISSLFEFAGGIGMFLYGMNTMADGMQRSAGGKMKKLLGYIGRGTRMPLQKPPQNTESSFFALPVISY